MAEQSSVKKIFSGSVWGILAKVIDAVAKFVTIPMLVGYYGKADYGLIALAFSLNAYLRLMDLGMNVGSVRFFAQWESKGKHEKIASASRSSMVFYGLIGLVNTLVFVLMADYGPQFFNIRADQVDTYRIMMYVLAASTIFNWLSNVVVQLLSAKDELGYVNRVTVISSILNFVFAFAAIQLKWSLEIYFLFYTLSLMAVIPFYVWKLKVYPLPRKELLWPRWDGKAFRQILHYSIAIFAMGLFQFSAKELRPILLAKYASGIDVLTDYRVIQTIANLIMSFGSIFLQVLLPSASKAHADNDLEKMDKLVFEATRYISIFLSLVVFLLIINADGLLTLYMGPEYSALTLWLIIWLLTVLLSMHNTPVASMVLSSGKTKVLVISAALGCLISLPYTAIYAEELGVGAAVIGYLIYMLIQMAFFYFYYIPKVLKLNSVRIFFRGFVPSLMGALVGSAGVWGLQMVYSPESILIGIIINSAVFILLYLVFLRIVVINGKDIAFLKTKLLKKTN
ncbi:hypothetical protein GCM10007049_34130 [Echinicola pacifica]|uniref:Membrane protein involved in the export of O-antigen and teichoic acid n=1 Tax=Echinicola pacifica TaxID=346377 RepID=A0A918QBM5_9BACT|nr:oligosaccharide flippase family protein [Echinicola pacifica]GGZ38035.1 hypothetical protein GCM10007049_34130 [Echinicola pacifica]